MSKIDRLVELFQSVEPAVRLEVLLDYADRLPPLPPEYAPLRDAGLGMIHECQSPVFLMAQAEGGRLRIVADAPREAPTARGFTSLLIEAFDGAPPEAVVAAPPNLLHALGLAELIGMQRTRGLSGIYARLRAEAARHAGPTS